MTGHLIHIGYAKTGTNFLRRWFGDHPQLVYVEGGVGGFQDVYDVARQAVASNRDVLYRVTSSEEFTAPRPSSGRIVDYSHDISAAQDAACAMLASLFPNARLLLVTRGFRSMILSSYSQYVRSGGDAALEELIRVDRTPPPWNYGRVIELYRNAFGEQNLMVMPYELLRDDPERFVRILEERLGLTHFPPSRSRVNTSLSPVEMVWYPRMTRFVRTLPIGARLKRMYVHGAFANRFRHAIALLQRFRPSTPVTADVIPGEIVRQCRGMAESLRANPLYAPYANEYFDAE